MTNDDLKNMVKDVIRDIVAKEAATQSCVQSPVKHDTTDYSVPQNQRDRVKRVAIGSDHTTIKEKSILISYLETLGYQVTDVGPNSTERVDYPDFAVAVAKKVQSGACERGIMIDGAGIGSCMACNKVRGIRAALCYDLRTVINSREHNNANVLTLGGPLHSGSELCEMTKLWLETRFGGARHWSRINKMMSIEREERK
jgi:ribose 5-phosphate isomerase B